MQKNAITDCFLITFILIEAIRSCEVCDVTVSISLTQEKENVIHTIVAIIFVSVCYELAALLLVSIAISNAI